MILMAIMHGLFVFVLVFLHGHDEQTPAIQHYEIMKIFKVYPENIDRRAIDAAVDALRDGLAVVYPTDSLYAIGCAALDNGAVERICRIKGIDPKKSELSIICDSLSQAAEYARIDNRAFRMLKANLPGPFTFILPASTTLPKVFKGRRAVGIRIPDNKVATALVSALGQPLMTTSITYETPDEAENPDEIALRYANIAAVMINGGDGQTEPSTVVDLTDSSEPEIIRQGAGTLE